MARPRERCGRAQQLCGRCGATAYEVEEGVVADEQAARAGDVEDGRWKKID
jgi:ribosomal protein L37E